MLAKQHQAGGKSCLSLLQTIPLFAGLPEVQLDQIARMAVSRKVARNSTIVFVGDSTDSLFVIVSGSAKVLNRDAEGNEVILTLLAAGECFG
ncbi:cyclic nucleotide-binding domain-containing protein [Propionivibrio sp.]|uniref:cyclic nucleotide-binding domain-containing protein n=1 Tax=Propionivibrio sp. TaxID=2212460 RepID=UPI003BF0EE65